VALGELSEKERTAILLFYLQDRPIKEIVRIMEIPEGSVKALLSRARTKMAKTINDYDR
jgi:RNA polymerase sigma-70 factor (ECF subfamily)